MNALKNFQMLEKILKKKKSKAHETPGKKRDITYLSYIYKN